MCSHISSFLALHLVMEDEVEMQTVNEMAGNASVLVSER